MHEPNAFDAARTVEARGKQRLAKWLDSVAYDGRWVWNAKGALAELIQRKFDVDVMLGVDQFESIGLEMKFLEHSPDAPFERWSNYVEHTEGVPDYALCRPGWGMTCQADLIGIYNISQDKGIVGRLQAWKDMLNERLESGLRRWHLYDQRFQTKRRQYNRTQIFWTPYSDLEKHAGFARFSAQQLELFDRGNPITKTA